jgi:hypothetical protein
MDLSAIFAVSGARQAYLAKGGMPRGRKVSGFFAVVQVYDPAESERLNERQRQFRAERKRLRQDLVTAHRFPNEG